MTTRRGLFGWLAGGLAASHFPWGKTPLATVASQAEFNGIIRRTFVPKVSAQLYTQSPMISILVPGRGYTSPPTISFVGEPEDGP